MLALWKYVTFPVNHRDVLRYFIQRKKTQKNPNTNTLSRSSLCAAGCCGVQQGPSVLGAAAGAAGGRAGRAGAAVLGAAASRAGTPVSLEQDLTENVAPGLDSFILIPEYKCCF